MNTKKNKTKISCAKWHICRVGFQKTKWSKFAASLVQSSEFEASNILSCNIGKQINRTTKKFSLLQNDIFFGEKISENGKQFQWYLSQEKIIQFEVWYSLKLPFYGPFYYALYERSLWALVFTFYRPLLKHLWSLLYHLKSMNLRANSELYNTIPWKHCSG